MTKIVIALVLAATLPAAGCAPAAAVAVAVGAGGTVAGVRMLPDTPCGSSGCIGTSVYIARPPPQPPGPGWIPPPPTFLVTFQGTKNGVPDIGPEGETLQGTLPAGNYWLTGYQNPSSGVASGTL